MLTQKELRSYVKQIVDSFIGVLTFGANQSQILQATVLHVIHFIVLGIFGCLFENPARIHVNIFDKYDINTIPTSFNTFVSINSTSNDSAIFKLPSPLSFSARMYSENAIVSW